MNATPQARIAGSTANGKINLYLGAGALRDDGYHELATVFQAVGIEERIRATTAADWGVDVVGERATATVPLDHTNLALMAGRLLHRETGRGGPTRFVIDKNVPVAAGMGGGSADAAAALVAYAGLWDLPLDRTDLLTFAARLGADVPFAVQGGTAIGVGRGDELAPVLTRQTFHWVLAFSDLELSTPDVYRRMDELRAERGAPALDPPRVPGELLQALAHGRPEDLAAQLHNDLAEAAIDLAPRLADVLAAGREAGTLAGIVSGSGPTLAFLVADARQAMEVAILLSATPGVAGVARTTSPHPGARPAVG